MSAECAAPDPEARVALGFVRGATSDSTDVGTERDEVVSPDGC
jgi:hypothetical protein